jgi:hypothetical protein
MVPFRIHCVVCPETHHQEMRQLLTREINDAVDGLLKGGAGQVLVWDGHDGSQTLSQGLTADGSPRSMRLMGLRLWRDISGRL